MALNCCRRVITFCSRHRRQAVRARSAISLIGVLVASMQTTRPAPSALDCRRPAGGRGWVWIGAMLSSYNCGLKLNEQRGSMKVPRRTWTSLHAKIGAPWVKSPRILLAFSSPMRGFRGTYIDQHLSVRIFPPEFRTQMKALWPGVLSDDPLL